MDGVFQKVIGFNTMWLRMTELLHIDMGVLIDPISVMMLVVITTVSFMVHLYSIGYMKGEQGLSTVFRKAFFIYFFHAGICCCNKHFPDVHLLGTCWCFILFTYWLLLPETICCCGFQESFYSNTFR